MNGEVRPPARASSRRPRCPNPRKLPGDRREHRDGDAPRNASLRAAPIRRLPIAGSRDYNPNEPTHEIGERSSLPACGPKRPGLSGCVKESSS